MLWPISRAENSSLYWLDEVHKYFYKQMFSGSTFDFCFPDEFIHVMVQSDRTANYFQAVYELYHRLPTKDQVVFSAIYEQQSNFSNLLENSAVDLIQSQVLENMGIWKASKDLGGYLYTTTLDLKCFREASAMKFDNPLVISTMKEHFQHFKQTNGSVCCFCGLEVMVAEVLVEPDNGVQSHEEKQRRASYDHYLPKAQFPFLAVDFNNLVPCCDVCNEDFKKEVNPLLDEKKRTLAFSPYGNELVKIAAAYENKDGEFYKMRVGVKNTNCSIEQKGHTWSKVFRSIERANAILENDFKEEWIAPLLCDVGNMENAKNKLNSFAITYSARSRISREAFYKSLCFSFLSALEDDTILPLIRAVSDSYSPRLGTV